MAGFLKQLFKPRKPHTQTQHLENSLHKLDDSRNDDRARLTQLARDAETANEHRLIIGHIKHLATLVSLYADSSHKRRAVIAERISELSADPTRVAAARQEIQDPQYRQILDQLSGLPAGDDHQSSPATATDSLEHIAVNGLTARERLNAVEQINDPDSLQRVARSLKGRDKGAFQTARQKLRNQRAEQAENEAAKARIEELIAQTEQHRATEDKSLYTARLEALEKKWHQIEQAADAEQKFRYLEAHAHCRKRAEKYAAEAEAQRALEEQNNEREGTILLLGDTLRQLATDVAEAGPSLSALDALHKTQNNRWLEATRESAPEAEQQQRFDQLMAELDSYMEAVRNFSNERGVLESTLSGESKPEDLAEILARIGWPHSYAAPDLIAQARKLAGQATRAKGKSQNTPTNQKTADSFERELQAALHNLQAALAEKTLNPAIKHFRSLQRLRDEAPALLVTRYRDRIAALGRELGELRDWQGFAVRPKQEALCEQMTYLAGQHMEPEAKAARIRELQKEWRDLGGSPDQTLWQQFKQAADEAYAPCLEYFAEKNKLKAANVAKRETICQQLTEFLDNADWQNCDWKAVEEIHRKARQEWQDARPVDLRANRPLQKEFDRLLKTIDAQLDTERQNNLSLKKAIVERAQALIDHEPLSEATAGAKNLQKEWQAIGITPHKEDRQLWQEYRAACDRIFGRLSAEKESESAAREEARKAAKTLISQVESLDASAADRQSIRDLEQQFRALSLPRDQAKGLQEQFRKALRTLEDARIKTLHQQRINQWLAALNCHQQNKPVPVESFTQPAGNNTGNGEPAEQARDLCIRAEILSGTTTPDEDQRQRMALQVNRLSESLQGQQSPESRWDELDGLLATFCQLPADPALPEALYQRLRASVDQLQTQSDN